MLTNHVKRLEVSNEKYYNEIKHVRIAINKQTPEIILKYFFI